jgi:ornithine lipid ester-linked acyl 2-hydroxylase
VAERINAARTTARSSSRGKITMTKRALQWLLQCIQIINKRHSLVGDRPFFQERDFPWIEKVKEQTPGILDELQKALLRRTELPNFQDILPGQSNITQDQNWKTFFFYGYGIRSPQNCLRCPKTDAALRHIPGVSTAFFSILAPGKHLPAHYGPYNGVLRFHLGLQIPAPSPICAIRVDNEVRGWADGEVLVFDDTYEHEVWNKSDQWRIVLFVDFLRPLPLWADTLNRIGIFLIQKTPYISIAMRNLKNWERDFYQQDSAESEK